MTGCPESRDRLLVSYVGLHGLRKGIWDIQSTPSCLKYCLGQSCLPHEHYAKRRLQTFPSCSLLSRSYSKISFAFMLILPHFGKAASCKARLDYSTHRVSLYLWIRFTSSVLSLLISLVLLMLCRPIHPVRII